MDQGKGFHSIEFFFTITCDSLKFRIDKAEFAILYNIDSNRRIEKEFVDKLSVEIRELTCVYRVWRFWHRDLSFVLGIEFWELLGRAPVTSLPAGPKSFVCYPCLISVFWGRDKPSDQGKWHFSAKRAIIKKIGC
jgi:hypothetical protein